ncbi:MAG: 2,3-bisphosphoglycerate-dependent phosphoglycerate mutase [Gammaproteobacteria bacterium]|nr:2,3-bisphosphoglycerate-dependent phosphoglycerate mutase [Gammaproteobacteria bacterium]
MDNPDPYLVLVRHGQSEWNEKNLFTGWKNPPLTEKGITEAIAAARRVSKLAIVFDVHFTSKLLRAQQTGKIILDELDQNHILTIQNLALNERNYGDLAGLNKDESRERWGEEQIRIWRRSFDTPPPGGESLKDTAERVIPYFQNQILPYLSTNKNVLICAHGNSLRALIMHLEGISPSEIVKLEIGTGEPLVYSGSKEELLTRIDLY